MNVQTICLRLCNCYIFNVTRIIIKKFKIDSTIPSCQNHRQKLPVANSKMDGPTLIVEKLRFQKVQSF